MGRTTVFELLATDGAARRGRLVTAHGAIETPVFMPCGTYGTVKAMTPAGLLEAGTQILLGNTFHLMLRPGDEVVRALGGLHRFMGWERPILTDSGGFQVWSLGELRKISETGVIFKSPVNGDRVELTPERSMAVQRNLGSDVVMVFDECTPYPPGRRWNSRCAGPRVAARPMVRGIGGCCSASFRAACTPVCARRVSPGCSSSGSTGMPSAGFPWASRRRKWIGC